MTKFTIPLLFIFSLVIADENRDFIDHMLNDMFEIYGPKNSQPQVDPEFIQQMTQEQWTTILKRWYGLDEDYKKNHQHWHQGKEDITFENFTNKVAFAPLHPNYLHVVGECKKRYLPHTSFTGKVLERLNLTNGKRNYEEILFKSFGDQWFDLNHHNNKTFSLTFWDWINTVAIKTTNHTYIHHSKPSTFRWNEPIPNEVVNEMIKEGSFDLYIELNMLRISGILMDEPRKLENKIPPKFNLYGKVSIDNFKDLKSCF